MNFYQLKRSSHMVNISLLFGLFANFAFASSEQITIKQSRSTHSIVRLCYSGVGSGSLMTPKDLILDDKSNLVIDGKHAELTLGVGSTPEQSSCTKTFIGTLSQTLPNEFSLKQSKSTCHSNSSSAQKHDEAIYLRNFSGDETDGSLFWVDNDYNHELGSCPASHFLMFRMTPII